MGIGLGTCQLCADAIALGMPAFGDVWKPALVVSAIIVAMIGLYSLATSRKHDRGSPRHIVSIACYGLFGILTGVLAVTSLGSIAREGHMSGYALLFHVAAAGGFTFVLLPLAVLFLPRGIDEQSDYYTYDQRWWLSRFSAWSLVLASLVTAGTMFLSMLPILGTQALNTVAEVHRYAGLAVIVSLVTHLMSLLVTRWGVR